MHILIRGSSGGVPFSNRVAASSIFLANARSSADTVVAPMCAQAIFPVAASHLNLWVVAACCVVSSECHTLLALAYQVSRRASHGSECTASLLFSGPCGSFPGILSGLISRRTALALASACRNKREVQWGLQPPSESLTTPATAAERSFETTKKSYTFVLHVGSTGAWMVPRTISGQPESASAFGLTFQSPPINQGPRTAATAAASSVNMAALVSLMPSPSLR